MNHVLFVLDSLTGQERIINKFFISEQEAHQYCADNDLIFSRTISDAEYFAIIQHQQNQQLLRQQRGYQQQQYPRTITTIQEQEPEEPLQQRIPRPPKPVFPFVQYKPVHPPRIHPNFVVTKKRGK
jgi:hypothetical protein